MIQRARLFIARIHIFLAVIFFLLLTAMTAFAATELNFVPSKVYVSPGESFDLIISLEPNEIKNYSTRVGLDYPIDLIELSYFKLGNDWVPLSKSENFEIDNIDGYVVNAAGYPGGFSSIKVFAKARFKAKGSGTGKITVNEDSFSLSAHNENLFSSTFPEIEVNVGDLRPAAIDEIPDQLFDINLELDRTSMEDISDLTARVIFVSFGKIPTPVSLEFKILDDKGKMIHVEEGDLVVETEKVYTKDFEGLKLPDGEYTLALTTLYNVDVSDEFQQDFRIGEEKPIIHWFSYVLGGTVLILILIIFVLLIRVKRKNPKNITE